MKKITILIVLATLCLFFKVSGQSNNQIRPLKVGDTVPDVVLQNVLNYKSTSIRLADFKDKLIILDFWATSCGPCIEHMPLMYSIQKKYKDQVFLLPVNTLHSGDDPTKILKFMKERKKAFDLPSVSKDTILFKLFHPSSLGVYVWIQNNVVRAFTGSEDLNEENIVKQINIRKVEFHQRPRLNFTWNKPIFINGNGGQEPSVYLYRSFLTPFIDGVFGAGFDHDNSGKIIRIYQYGVSLKMLIIAANPEFGHFQPARIKIKVRDPEPFDFDLNNDSLRRKNEFDYEAVFPPANRSVAQAYFKQDIGRYFPYSIDSASIKDSCWVLKVSRVKKLKVNRTAERGTNYDENIGLPIFFNNMPVSEIVRAFENIYKSPFIDETGYNGNLWLTLPPNLLNSNALQISLAKQGIILTKEPREIEYAVISGRDLPN